MSSCCALAQERLADRFSPIVMGIRDELDSGRPGAAAIADDLASALFVMMLRDHLENSPPADGLLALLGQRIDRAGGAGDAARSGADLDAWTILRTWPRPRGPLWCAPSEQGGRCGAVGLPDRSAAWVGPHRLWMGAVSIDQIAAEVGYQSQAAFSRAFLRNYGIRPGALRQ